MPDLVIGGRRASPQRSLRAAGLLVALVFTAFVVAWFIYRRSVAYEMPGGEPVATPVVLEQPAGLGPRLRWGDATLGHAGDLVVLRATGEPFTIGAAQGRLLADHLGPTARAMAPSIDGLAGAGGWLGGVTAGMRKDWRLRFIDDGINDRHRRGLAGLVRGAAASGAGLSYAETLRQAAVFDVGVPAPWTAEVATRNLTRALTVAPLGRRRGRTGCGSAAPSRRPGSATGARPWVTR
ncbi:MAG: hypothetical protein R3B06_32820 [Kofleriaceae bacterium]